MKWRRPREDLVALLDEVIPRGQAAVEFKPIAVSGVMPDYDFAVAECGPGEPTSEFTSREAAERYMARVRLWQGVEGFPYPTVEETA